MDASSAYTHSVFIKAGGGTYGTSWVDVYVRDKDGTGYHAHFNLATGAFGTVTAGATGAVTSYGNGWYRVSSTISDSGTGATQPLIGIYFDETDNDITFDGDGTSYLYVWGAQLEKASFPSSYIPTTTATVTRNADVLTFPTSGNVSATIGTAYASVRHPLVGISAQGIVGFKSTEASHALYKRGAANEKYSIYDGTSVLEGDNSTTSVNKVASRWDSGDSLKRIVLNGGTVASGAFDGSMVVGTDAIVGSETTTIGYLWGNIKNLRIWNRALTDAELQAITS
jgi:hypothetical protein